MGVALARWLVWPALILSVFLWLVLSLVTADAAHTLVKSNFDFTRSFGSVSMKTLVSAFVWSIIISYWIAKTATVGGRSLFLGACTVAVWTTGVIILTSVGIDQLWNFRWAVIAFPIVAWILETVIAMWLLRLMSPPQSFGIGIQGMLWNATTALTWLMATKAVLLCLSPGVTIRL
jgi:hypothetical protein